MSNAINVRVVSPITTKGFRKDSDFDTIRNLDLNDTLKYCWICNISKNKR